MKVCKMSYNILQDDIFKYILKKYMNFIQHFTEICS